MVVDQFWATKSILIFSPQNLILIKLLKEGLSSSKSDQSSTK